MRRDHVFLAGLGIWASTLATGTAVVGYRAMQRPYSHGGTSAGGIEIQRPYPSQSPARRIERGDTKRNTKLGRFLKSPQMIDHLDTNLAERGFSFEGWTYVPIESFNPNDTETQTNKLDTYIENMIRSDHDLQLGSGDREYLENMPDFSGKSTRETISNVTDYIKSRRRKNWTRSIKPQPIKDTLEGDGNCLDYSTAFIYIARKENENPNIHFASVSLYRNDGNKTVGHAVIFPFDTRKKQFSVIDIYSDAPIESATVRTR